MLGIFLRFLLSTRSVTGAASGGVERIVGTQPAQWMNSKPAFLGLRKSPANLPHGRA